jgi:hypothetical protein
MSDTLYLTQGSSLASVRGGRGLGRPDHDCSSARLQANLEPKAVWRSLAFGTRHIGNGKPRTIRPEMLLTSQEGVIFFTDDGVCIAGDVVYLFS